MAEVAGMPEALGFLASALVLLTFGMRTMLPMRLLAILSNLAFMAYGASLGLTPVWALHGILLPLNLWRLRELRRRALPGASAAPGARSLERLRPVVAERRLLAGEVLFRRGEPARELFYVLEGRVRLRDLDGGIGHGGPLAGLGLSAPGGRRSATAVCETDCELLVVSATSRDPRPEPIRPRPFHPRSAGRRLPDFTGFPQLADWAQRRSG